MGHRTHFENQEGARRSLEELEHMETILTKMMTQAEPSKAIEKARQPSEYKARRNKQWEMVKCIFFNLVLKTIKCD